MCGEFGFFIAVGEKPTDKPEVCRLAVKKQFMQSGFRQRTEDFAKQSFGSNGAAPQSSIESSAVCLKADRQTNRFAAFVLESIGFAPAGRGLQAARDCYPEICENFRNPQSSSKSTKS